MQTQNRGNNLVKAEGGDRVGGAHVCVHSAEGSQPITSAWCEKQTASISQQRHGHDGMLRGLSLSTTPSIIRLGRYCAKRTMKYDCPNVKTTKWVAQMILSVMKPSGVNTRASWRAYLRDSSASTASEHPFWSSQSHSIKERRRKCLYQIETHKHCNLLRDVANFPLEQNSGTPT